MGHSDTHGHGGSSHGSAKEYIIGLILSIVLTIIPFYLVQTCVDGGCAIAPSMTFFVIFLCAVGQLLVQLIFFLHLSTKSDQIWNTISATFIIIIVAILIIGSIWVLRHLNHNMLMGH